MEESGLGFISGSSFATEYNEVVSTYESCLCSQNYQEHDFTWIVLCSQARGHLAAVHSSLTKCSSGSSPREMARKKSRVRDSSVASTSVLERSLASASSSAKELPSLSEFMVKKWRPG